MTITIYRGSRVMLLAGILAGSMLFAVAEKPAPQANGTKAAKTAIPQHMRSQQARRAALGKRTWGIEVIGVHLVSSGYMLEFKYHVVDSQKASQFGDRKVRPYLIEQATGAKVFVPAPQKIGQLRNTSSLEEGRNYWIMFANPGRRIKAGDKVAVVVGNFRANDIVVN